MICRITPSTHRSDTVARFVGQSEGARALTVEFSCIHNHHKSHNFHSANQEGYWGVGSTGLIEAHGGRLPVGAAHRGGAVVPSKELHPRLEEGPVQITPQLEARSA